MNLIWLTTNLKRPIEKKTLQSNLWNKAIVPMMYQIDFDIIAPGWLQNVTYDQIYFFCLSTKMDQRLKDISLFYYIIYRVLYYYIIILDLNYYLKHFRSSPVFTLIIKQTEKSLALMILITFWSANSWSKKNRLYLFHILGTLSSIIDSTKKTLKTYFSKCTYHL